MYECFLVCSCDISENVTIITYEKVGCTLIAHKFKLFGKQALECKGNAKLHEKN